MRWPAILYLACLAACSEDLDGVRPDGMRPDGVVADESGRACESSVATGGATVVASPSLDCPSRQCLHVQNLAPDECTATCTTAGECLAASASACTAGFVCQPVIAVGPFACQSFCVCADRAFAPPAGCVTAVRPAP